MINKLIEFGNSFLASKYSTVILGIVVGVLGYFYISTKITISNQEEQIAELNNMLGESKQQVVIERKRCNNQIEVSILKKNNEVLKKQNDILKESKKELETYNLKQKEDLNNVSNEINVIKNKTCLQKEIDEDIKQVLNNIFNGE